MSKIFQKKIRRSYAKPFRLNLTPMIDIFTTLLIFLLVGFISQESEYRSKTQLPKAQMPVKEWPRLRVEVSTETVSLNGKKIEGLNPQKNVGWTGLQVDLAKVSKLAEPILIVADERADFSLVDRTVSTLAEAGYSEFLLLTEVADK